MSDCCPDFDGLNCGRDDRYLCFIDPTPQHQWEITTPQEVYG